MQALRWSLDNGIELDTAHAEPLLQPGWAILRVLAAAYSTWDLAAARGDWDEQGGRPTRLSEETARRGITLGRQCVGMLEGAAPQTDHEERVLEHIGTQRVVPSVYAVNPEAEVVRAGLPSHDPDRRTLGIGLDGALANLVAVPIMNLHAVPESVESSHAVLAEAVGGAVHASTQLHLQGKPYITVLGDGRQALLCAQAMSALNASVRIVGEQHAKLELCEKVGVPARHIDDVGRRQDQDVVVDCTGTARGFNTAVAMTRPRGKLLLRSMVDRTRSELVDLGNVVDREIEVVGSRDGSVAEGLLALASGAVRVGPLINARVRLSDAAPDIVSAASPSESAIRVVTLVEP